MRKLKYILAAAFVMLLSLGCLAACGGHEHQLDKWWSADREKHWIRCTSCGAHCQEQAHDFKDGVCTVCEYQQIFLIMIDWGEVFDEKTEEIVNSGSTFELKLDLLSTAGSEYHRGWVSLYAGYEFLGFSATPGGEILADNNIVASADVTFYANWRPIDYTVNFHTQTGTAPAPMHFNVHTKDELVLPSLKDDVMTFLYWSTQSDGDDVGTLGFENYDLYAVWAQIKPYHNEADHLAMAVGDVCSVCGYSVAAQGNFAVLMQKGDDFRAEYYGNSAADDFADHADVITQIYIGQSVRMIDNFAFADCTKLQEVVFAGCGRLKTVGDYAFFGCSSLEQIDMPLSVTQINAFAFAYCNQLKNITLGSADKINYHTFAGCTSLAELILPDSVTEIAPYAFSGAVIESLTINGGLKTVGEMAFMDCTLRSVSFKGSFEQWSGVEIFQGNLPLQEADIKFE